MNMFMVVIGTSLGVFAFVTSVFMFKNAYKDFNAPKGSFDKDTWWFPFALGVASLHVALVAWNSVFLFLEGL